MLRHDNKKKMTAFSVILIFENLATSKKDLYSGNTNEEAFIKYLAKCCYFRDGGTEVYVSLIILNLCFNYIF